MTLDEAIEIFEADKSETILNLSELRSNELVNWLEELKTLRYCKDKWNENQYEQGRADERKKILDILKTFIESDYNSKECKLMVSDLREFLWEGAEE